MTEPHTANLNEQLSNMQRYIESLGIADINILIALCDAEIDTARTLNSVRKSMLTTISEHYPSIPYKHLFNELTRDALIISTLTLSIALHEHRMRLIESSTASNNTPTT